MVGDLLTNRNFNSMNKFLCLILSPLTLVDDEIVCDLVEEKIRQYE
jgi:hypothetical protein